MPLSLPPGRTASAFLVAAVLTGCAATHYAATDPPAASPTATTPPSSPSPGRTTTRGAGASRALTKTRRGYLRTRPGELPQAARQDQDGMSYTFNPGLRTVTASIVKAEILATLLL